MNFLINIAESVYRQHKSMSQSLLKKLLKSKKHFLMHKTMKKTESMVFGSAFHDLLLRGPAYFNDNYEVCGYRKRLQDLNKTRLKETDYDKILEMVSHVNQYPLGEKIPLLDREKAIFWEMRGIGCKGLLDLVDREECELIDIKTIDSLSNHRHLESYLRSVINNYRYDFQIAFYLNGLKILSNKDWKHSLYFIEKKPPFQFIKVVIHPSSLVKAELDINQCIDIFLDPTRDDFGEYNYPKDGEGLILDLSYKPKETDDENIANQVI